MKFVSGEGNFLRNLVGSRANFQGRGKDFSLTMVLKNYHGCRSHSKIDL